MMMSLGLGEDRPEKSEAEVKNEVYGRDPDSRPPTNLVQKVMDRIHRVWRWTKTAEAMVSSVIIFYLGCVN